MPIELNSVKEAALFCLKNNLSVVEVNASDLLTLVDEGEKILEENKKLKKISDAKIVFAEAVDKETQWALQEENIRLKKVIREIKNITESLTEFNPTYEKINNIAIEGLEVPK